MFILYEFIYFSHKINLDFGCHLDRLFNKGRDHYFYYSKLASIFYFHLTAEVPTIISESKATKYKKRTPLCESTLFP